MPGGSELQPVSGIIKSDGQSLTLRRHQGQDRRRRGHRQYRCEAGRQRHCAERERPVSGVDGTALRYRNLAMPAGRASMQMTLTSQGRSASALTGALSGSGTRDAGIRRGSPASIRAPSRSRSAPATAGRQGRRQAEADRRTALSAGALVGRFGANPVHHQRRPASRRRDHAGRQGRARHRLRRLRYPRRPGRHPRRACPDDDDRPSGDSAVCRRARPTRSPAPSTSRRCRPGWRCARSITRPEGSMPSSAASRRRRRRRQSLPPADGQAPIPAAAPSAAGDPVPLPGRDPRGPRRSKATAPRPPAPPVECAARASPHGASREQQVAPLPPPIDVRPAPGPAKPKPRPPLALTPQIANPPPRSN